jgi:FKBP-type peptidyl-prolyl cis-trans isomerase SlyD
MAESLQDFRDMRVRKDSLVVIEYTIRDADGHVVDSSLGRRPFVYVHGHEQIVPGIEAALTGAGAGSRMDLSIPARHAYGERDPRALRILPRRSFPASEPPEAGCLYRAVAGDGRACIFTVIDVTTKNVLVDTNHPLAGQTLAVHVEVISVMGSATALC